MSVRRKIPICESCGLRKQLPNSHLCWSCDLALKEEKEREELEKDAAWVREQRLKAEDEARRVPDGWPPYAG